LRQARMGATESHVGELLDTIHERFERLRKQYGEKTVAALASANNTNEALFLMKTYFQGHVDFRLGREVELYQQRQDDLLRRLDKHANTQGALDLGLSGDLNGLRGMRELAEKKDIRGMWISFHPQLVGEDSQEIITELNRLISALEFSVVSTTHDFEWSRRASIVLPMAAWGEEVGTYTNYAGRIQITNRAVMPPGDAQPLHMLMAEMLGMTGAQVPTEPAAIFDWITRDVAAYSGLDYDSIGLLGATPAAAPQEVLR
jgi:predicted molibdopterin-dependent oxidoreductase YjgC